MIHVLCQRVAILVAACFGPSLTEAVRFFESPAVFSKLRARRVPSSGFNAGRDEQSGTIAGANETKKGCLHVIFSDRFVCEILQLGDIFIMEVIQRCIFLSWGTLRVHVDADCPAGTFVAKYDCKMHLFSMFSITAACVFFENTKKTRQDKPCRRKIKK